MRPIDFHSVKSSIIIRAKRISWSLVMIPITERYSNMISTRMNGWWRNWKRTCKRNIWIAQLLSVWTRIKWWLQEEDLLHRLLSGFTRSQQKSWRRIQRCRLVEMHMLLWTVEEVSMSLEGFQARNDWTLLRNTMKRQRVGRMLLPWNINDIIWLPALSMKESKAFMLLEGSMEVLMLRSMIRLKSTILKRILGLYWLLSWKVLCGHVLQFRFKTKLQS